MAATFTPAGMSWNDTPEQAAQTIYKHMTQEIKGCKHVNNPDMAVLLADSCALISACCGIPITLRSDISARAYWGIRHALCAVGYDDIAIVTAQVASIIAGAWRYDDPDNGSYYDIMVKYTHDAVEAAYCHALDIFTYAQRVQFNPQADPRIRETIKVMAHELLRALHRALVNVRGLCWNGDEFAQEAEAAIGRAALRTVCK